MEERSVNLSGRRIEVIDALRGFALAGILYAHMIIWYTGAALPPDVYTKYDSTADGIALGIFGALVFGKFFSVFSFLFGLSFYLHFKRKSGEPGYLKIYIWRLFLLFLIGLIHHMLWRGDILAIYAILGLVLIFFRNLSPKLILILAVILIINLPTHLYELFQNTNSTDQVEFPMAERAAQYYDLVNNESFTTVLIQNWRSWPSKITYQLESGRLLMTFGYFLLGLYAGRLKLFTAMQKHITKFKLWNQASGKAVLFLLFLGLLMYLFNLVSIPGIKVVPGLQWPASFLFSVYNACLTIFYLTGFSLLFQNQTFRRILKPLASMGRMALTIYLTQTIFGLLLFYHFGLALFDRTSPAINVIMGVLVFFIQLRFSQWWLRKYKQGPFEWLWKGLTYFNFSANKKK